MTNDKQLFAEYKATAPGLDLQFFMNTATLTADERGNAVELLMLTRTDGTLTKGVKRAEFYRRLCNLQDAWRRRAEATMRAENLAEQARIDAMYEAEVA